jgi:hypothetical protein
MRFGNSRDELETALWEEYAETRDWILSPGVSLKTVYGEFRGSAGNLYETSDAIRFIKKKIVSDGGAGNNFGCSVAVITDGSMTVVGAFSAGSVYIIPLN